MSLVSIIGLLLSQMYLLISVLDPRDFPTLLIYPFLFGQRVYIGVGGVSGHVIGHGSSVFIPPSGTLSYFPAYLKHCANGSYFKNQCFSPSPSRL